MIKSLFPLWLPTVELQEDGPVLCIVLVFTYTVLCIIFFSVAVLSSSLFARCGSVFGFLYFVSQIVRIYKVLFF